MFLNKKFDLALIVIIMMISVSTSLYIAYNTTNVGYEKLYILPFLFGLMYTFFISPIRRRLNNIYIYVFIAVCFTRYIILPTLITITGHYDGRSSISPNEISFQRAIDLMSYEMIVISIITYFLFRKTYLNNKEKSVYEKVRLPNSIFVYVLFISFSILLGLVFPDSFKSFAFLKPSDDFSNFNSSAMHITLITYSLVISKFLMFVLVMGFFYKKYLVSKNFIYIILSFLAVALSISIFFGANRADYVITTIASILLFGKLYPKHIKLLVIPLLLIFILTVSIINEERNNAVSAEDPLVELTNTLQIYLAGPYNVAISIEAADLNIQSKNRVHIFHEILRPVMGLNVFLKQFDIKSTSDYFNERIFFSNQKTQIVPMIGQGYFYFGFLLAPLIMVFYLILVKYLINIQSQQNRLEIVFFFSIAIARTGLATAQNGAILANDISFFLGLFLIIYILNNCFVIKKAY